MATEYTTHGGMPASLIVILSHPSVSTLRRHAAPGDRHANSASSARDFFSASKRVVSGGTYLAPCFAWRQGVCERHLGSVPQTARIARRCLRCQDSAADRLLLLPRSGLPWKAVEQLGRRQRFRHEVFFRDRRSPGPAGQRAGLRLRFRDAGTAATGEHGENDRASRGTLHAGQDSQSSRPRERWLALLLDASRFDSRHDR